jgi:hypothetical protein
VWFYSELLLIHILPASLSALRLGACTVRAIATAARSMAAVPAATRF